MWLIAYIIKNFKEVLINKYSFLIKSIMMVISDLFFLVVWLLILKSSNLVSVKEGVIFLSFSYLTFGLVDFFARGIIELPMIIEKKELEKFLLLPGSTLLHITFSRIGYASLGDLFLGLFLLIYSKPPLLTYLFIPSAFLTLYSIFFFLGTLTLYFKRSPGKLFDVVFSFSVWPIESIPSIIKFLLLTVIPVLVISYLPSKFVVLQNIHLLIYSYFISAAFFFCVYFLFKIGLKKYEEI